MNSAIVSLEQLKVSLATPTRGVLGLVDELLAAAREHGLQFGWHGDYCRVRFAEGCPADWIDVPLRKSVVRAALARIAVLCNEHQPHSVSPYGGQGELLVDAEPPARLRVAFVNTPDEQSLDLAPVDRDEADGKAGNDEHPASAPQANGSSNARAAEPKHASA